MLTQLATVRARLGLTELELQWDPLLTNAIAGVSRRFDRECNRTLARTVDFAQEFCAGDTEIALACFPLESITRIELKSKEAEGWSEVAGVNYLLRRSCVLSFEEPPGTDRQLGRLIYTGGYVLPGTAAEPGQMPLPADLEQAAVEQVAFWFQNRERLGLSRLWEYHGTYRQFNDLDLATPVQAVLAHYRKIN